jgi:cytochrome c biogenesis protein CcmG/thiol:disulfide interchange protein DsbE
VAAVVAVLVGLGVGLNVVAGGPSGASVPSAAPPVEGPVTTGGHFSLADQRDHWVLVNFFASWCTDCKTELGQLVTLQRQRPGGLEVVSIDGQDDSLGAAEALIRQAGGSWPLVDDPGALSSYRVTGLPQSFLVDPAGRVVDRTFGTISADAVASRVRAG